MTERKFTRNLKSRGMAQQLRESVSKVIHQDLINVCSATSIKTFQSHHDPIDNFPYEGSIAREDGSEAARCLRCEQNKDFYCLPSDSVCQGIEATEKGKKSYLMTRRTKRNPRLIIFIFVKKFKSRGETKAGKKV